MKSCDLNDAKKEESFRTTSFKSWESDEESTMPSLPSPGLSFSEFQKFWRDEAITNGWQIPNEPTIHDLPMTEAEAVKSEERIERFRNRFREAEKYRKEQAEAAVKSTDERIQKVTQNFGKPIMWDFDQGLLQNANAHRAAASGRLWVLKEIARTQSRSELFKADRNGWTPMHEAARGGHADVLEYLLQEGSLVNERTNNNNGGTALFWARKNAMKNAKAIAVLEKYGAVYIEPSLGVAHRREWFSQLYSNLNSHDAAGSGLLDKLKEIARTQSRIELFKADRHGWRPIHEAARGGHADVLEYLLKEGAKVNERTANNNGMNALFLAKKNAKKNAKAIAVLEKYGAVEIAPSFTNENNAAELCSKVIDKYIDNPSNVRVKKWALDYVQHCNSTHELRSIINRLFYVMEDSSASVKVAATKRLNAISPTPSKGKHRLPRRWDPDSG